MTIIISEAATRKILEKPTFRQSYTVGGPLLLTIGVGLTMGYSAVLLPQLQSENGTSIATTTEQQTFIASLGALPMALGTLFGGFLVERVGRRATHISTTLPTAAGWLLIYFAHNLELLLAGRFVTGLTSGLLSAATGIYFGEISEPKLRGFFIGATSLSVSLGIFLSHLAGTLTTWRNSALIFSIFPIVGWALMANTPESPHWLLSKDKRPEAEESFYWLRGKTPETEEEFKKMTEREGRKEDGENTPILSGRFLRPIALVCALMVCGQWTGHNAVTFYSISVIRQTVVRGGASLFDEYAATLLIDASRIVTSAVGCVLLKRIARRTLGVWGNAGAFCSLTVLASHSYFLGGRQQHVLVPLAALLAFVTFASVCVVPLPWTLLGELLPLRAKGAGGAVCSCAAFVAAFAVVQATPAMLAGLGPAGAFLVFAAAAAAGAALVFFLLPETKDKTLREIEDGFRKGPAAVQ